MDSSLVLSGQGMKDPNDAYDMIAQTSSTIIMLDLTNNYLKDFNVAINFLQLKFLLLDNNMIASIENFPIIPTLENLSLNNNSIRDPMSFVMNVSDKYPKLTSINTLRNPMNPGFDQPEAYKKYKAILKAITTLRMVDGMDVNDQSTVDYLKYKNDMTQKSNTGATMKNSMSNFFNAKPAVNPKPVVNQPLQSSMSSFLQSSVVASQPKQPEKIYHQPQPQRLYFPIDEDGEIDGEPYVKANNGKSYIYYSEKQLKKSDNLTKFNRKNHSEGNKHILNNHL